MLTLTKYQRIDKNTHLTYRGDMKIDMKPQMYFDASSKKIKKKIFSKILSYL